MIFLDNKKKIKKRLKICNICEHKSVGICKICKCFIEIKTRLKNAKCPINKW